jgi:hypothetical protein
MRGRGIAVFPTLQPLITITPLKEAATQHIAEKGTLSELFASCPVACGRIPAST